jgi:tetratricopeptide (TPR) repeat protein
VAGTGERAQIFWHELTRRATGLLAERTNAGFEICWAFRLPGILLADLDMHEHGSTADWLVGLMGILCGVGSGCGKAKPKPPPPPVASVSQAPCAGGETRDPPHQQARPAIQALRSKDYEMATRLFEAELAEYPESSSLRVWLGDARLGQGTSASIQAALDAYDEARALDASGCKLRERERFFLAIGVADVAIRQQHAELALAKLTDSEQTWPDNAEVRYLRARAECALDKREACFDDLRSALTLAQTRQHARLSRSHHSSDRLVERAATQSEFEVLRKEPRYRALLASAAASDAGASTVEPALP